MTADRGRQGPVALVTGAFSGIGQATALELARAGWTVYASGRNLTHSGDLCSQAASLDVRPLVLDVTDGASITAAVDQIAQQSNRLDVLVNNAGFAVHGPVTETSQAQMRQQFETNVIGAVATSRAALALMRRHGRGRIINISSIFGKVPFPGSGVYSATKAALEAVSDVMRLELKLIGPDYRVVIIDVSETKTKLGDKAVYAEHGECPSSMYGDFNTIVRNYVAHAYTHATEPEAVARVVLTAATAAKPRSRYIVTRKARAWLALGALLPDPAVDRAILLFTPQLRRRIRERNSAGPLR